jgi:hypothetical protein
MHAVADRPKKIHELLNSKKQNWSKLIANK